MDRTERCDRFLADQLHISRTQAGRLIAHKRVTVNGEPVRASHHLERGAEIVIDLIDTRPPRNLAPLDLELRFVYEDESLAVIDKPAGLVVHPAPGHWDDTLVNALVHRGMRLADGSLGRPGIVHRLDRDTSGLLIIAKNDDVHRALSRQLAARHIRRAYAALIWGHLSARPDPLVIDAPIARHPRDRKRMAVLATGREARTSLHQVARFDVADLVRVELQTGRTHQIRVHLAHIGHAVVGDPVYRGGGARGLSGPARPAAEHLERAAPRQALHAAELRFDHPVTGEPVVARSEWPSDLAPALDAAASAVDRLDRANPLQYFDFYASHG